MDRYNSSRHATEAISVGNVGTRSPNRYAALSSLSSATSISPNLCLTRHLDFLASTATPCAPDCDPLLETYLRCVSSKRGLSHVDDCGEEANAYRFCVQKESGNQARSVKRVEYERAQREREALEDQD
jgi:hypothetical protein